MTEQIPIEWFEPLITIVKEAGDAILQVYETDFAVQTKTDESPLTQADLAAHEVITAGLSRLTPDIPIISEESTPPEFSVRASWPRYWLVDPLDGTKEFVNRNGEFTVNIALIAGHESVLGLVGVPVQDKVYVGDVTRSEAVVIESEGRRPLAGAPRLPADEQMRVVASRRHGGARLSNYLDELMRTFPALERRPVGSSLKLCVLAEGLADIYPRLGPTSEWDIGAAQAVLTAAGGTVITAAGDVLRYNTKDSLLNPEFLAVADAGFNWSSVLPKFPHPD